MAHHYHITYKLDYSKHGGTKEDRYYGPALPLEQARLDAKGLAAERGLTQFAGGIWGDAEWYEQQSTFVTPDVGQSIQIDPCDNTVDFDLRWNAYQDKESLEFCRASKGQPCSTVIHKEYWVVLGGNPEQDFENRFCDCGKGEYCPQYGREFHRSRSTTDDQNAWFPGCESFFSI